MFNPSFTHEYPNTSQFSYFLPPPPPPPPPSSNHHLPPGLNPIAHPPHFQQSQLPFGHDDPNAPISYPPAMTYLNDANYMWSSNWTNQDPSFLYHPTNVTSESIAVKFPGTASGADIVSFANEMCSVSGAQVGSTSVVANGEEMGIKSGKAVNNGVPAGYPKVCKMCDVTCYGPEVYKMHLAGKKHAAKANLMHGRKLNSAPKIQSKFNGKVKKEANGGKFPVSVWCQYCNIFSNSQDAYAKHIVGKKHQKNLKNIETASTSSVPLGSSSSQTGHYSIQDDLEARKKKVIRAGAAASEVRTCIDCNTVCNSQIAFNLHLAGQKHAAMVAKRVAESSV